jgi:hypothetical protein
LPVNVELKSVHEHMLKLGLGALAHANWHAHFSSWENDYWPQLSVLQAAHAAEIFLKARIAQEHPLLIFEQLPRSTHTDGTLLSLAHLVERARTLQYADLPDRLWATTGIRLDDPDLYQQFGRLRNTLQHFVPPAGRDFSHETSRFIYGVVDPFINKCWGLYAVDFCEDSAGSEYLLPTLAKRAIEFLVPPGTSKSLISEHDWPKKDPEYRAAMELRFSEAANKQATD